jgi:hypothetical protein
MGAWFRPAMAATRIEQRNAPIKPGVVPLIASDGAITMK